MWDQKLLILMSLLPMALLIIFKYVPIYGVLISFKNYKVTILGEVRNPGTYVLESEKNNILQALGKAGDLNLTAKRDGIILIREVDGVMTHYTIDLRKSNILDSPYFYLQQNDVIYVPANSSRVAAANTATGIWSIAISSVSSIVAVASLLLSQPWSR